ncbi:MAG TPA: helix-turn-helix transcriptional regulator [Anaerolineae bacterium]|nr:helix-turn-helix transcriptional regulator [Anaerolineae bacterium]
MADYFRETRAAPDEPMFVISVAARLVEMHPQTLRYYERAGLVKPTRSRGRIRLYSQRDIERLRKIARLVDDLGVNLAGVEVILNLTERLELLQKILEKYNIQLPDSDSNGFEQERPALPATTATPAQPTRIQVRRPRSKTA